MNTVTSMSGTKFVFTAVSLAFVPLMAFSQDKATANSATAGTAPGQSAKSATGAAGPNGMAGADTKATADASAAANTQGKQKAGANAGAVLLFVPVNAPEQNQWKEKGCWAKFYDDQNYGGDSLTLMGPIDMADMTGPFGINWNGKISSVETGPKTRVLVYDNKNFQDLVATFKPSQKSPDVSKKMGFFDEFGSVKIACDNLKAKSAAKGEANGAGKS
jgi:hypothetical protein